MKPLYFYLLLINAVAFILMLWDKQKAKKKLWRIPEVTLIWTAVLGGSIGTIFGMYIARHKTKHPKFAIGIPFILLLQCILLILHQATTP